MPVAVAYPVLDAVLVVGVSIVVTLCRLKAAAATLAVRALWVRLSVCMLPVRASEITTIAGNMLATVLIHGAIFVDVTSAVSTIVIAVATIRARERG